MWTQDILQTKTNSGIHQSRALEADGRRARRDWRPGLPVEDLDDHAPDAMVEGGAYVPQVDQVREAQGYLAVLKLLSHLEWRFLGPRFQRLGSELSAFKLHCKLAQSLARTRLTRIHSGRGDLVHLKRPNEVLMMRSGHEGRSKLYVGAFEAVGMRRILPYWPPGRRSATAIRGPCPLPLLAPAAVPASTAPATRSGAFMSRPVAIDQWVISVSMSV